MSAFVINKATMDQCVGAILHRSRYGYVLQSFNGVMTDKPDAGVWIGRALYRMNIEAVQQRYPDTRANPSNMPGPHGAHTLYASYTYRRPRNAEQPNEGLVAGIKALNCLAYQCSEGTVPDCDLFKELEAAIGKLACQYVCELPAYDAATWGN